METVVGPTFRRNSKAQQSRKVRDLFNNAFVAANRMLSRIDPDEHVAWRFSPHRFYDNVE